MSYCPKCGNKIDDEIKGCVNCNPNIGTQHEDDTELNIVIRVLIIALVIFTGPLGGVVGIAGGTALLKHRYQSYRGFGKILIGVGLAMVIISIICCVVGGIFNFAIINSVSF